MTHTFNKMTNNVAIAFTLSCRMTIYADGTVLETLTKMSETCRQNKVGNLT